MDAISFHVAPGEIVGLVGPNGAGKTTTINMILGVLEPSGGRIEIEGVDLAVDRSRALAGTNFAAVYAPLPGNLTVEQNLRVFGMLYAVSNLSERIERLLAVYDLGRYRRTKAGFCRPASRPDSASPRRCSICRGCSCSTSRPPPSIPRTRARFAPASPSSSTADIAGSCGRATTCTRSRRSATGCCSCRTGRIVLEGDPKTLPEEHGAASLDDLFVNVAQEALDAARPVMSRSRVGAVVLRILYLYRGSPQRIFPIFVWVAVDIVLWGFLTRYLNSVSRAPTSTSCRRCSARSCCGIF